MSDAEILIAEMAAKARTACRALARASDADKAAALQSAAAELRAQASIILEANAADMAAGEQAGLSAAMLDRLKLDTGRIEGIASAVEQVSALLLDALRRGL